MIYLSQFTRHSKKLFFITTYKNFANKIISCVANGRVCQCINDTRSCKLDKSSIIFSQTCFSLTSYNHPSIIRTFLTNNKPAHLLVPYQHHYYTNKRYFTSDDSFDDNMADNRFCVGYAKLGTSSCKKCKQKIEKGALRIAKLVSNPFSDEGGDMKQWFHPACIFETFVRARATTKKIEDTEDLEGFADIQQEDKDAVLKLIKDFLEKQGTPGKKKTPAKKTPAKQAATIKAEPSPIKTEPEPSTSKKDPVVESKDDSFREFRRLCADIAEESGYTGKTAIIKEFITKGSSGDGYTGNLYLLTKLLLPGVVKSVYNLNNKQLVKLFSQIFHTSLKEMQEDLEQGDVAETIRIFFEKSKAFPPQKKCQLSIIDVNSLLEELSTVTKEDEQERVLIKITKKCTANDLKMVIRLIKHDLRINSGAKPIMDALDSNAYQAFQASRNLQDVIDRILSNRDESKPGMSKKLSVRASLMTPVLPMLAEACRSVDQAMKKCPNGFYAEIKYDGERVQLHKNGSEFQYFSRSLKPVLPHKVSHFKEFIPKAFPTGDNLILDAEVLLIDTTTGVPLPFGSLGKHKKEQFKDAKVCLFIFDCLHLNEENIMARPLKERRRLLEKNMIEVENRVKFSEMKFMNDSDELMDMMNKVFQDGLEGLVLKDINGVYEPGKRHWLKVKKDYLNEGQMADSADLVVLGGYYGTGNKGGMMSVFLTGVYDPETKLWCTVTKVGGFDDATLEKLQTEMDMIKVSKNISKVPDWLHIKKNVVPDFIVTDPKKSPVWEVAGAEFSKAEVHTADGISIRFPRVMKVRDDKSWKEATDLPRLKELFKQSKDTSDLVIPGTKGKGKTPVKRKKSSEGNNSDDSDSGGKGAGAEKTPTKRKKSSEGNTSKSATPSSSQSTSSPNILKYFSPKKEKEEQTPTKENGDHTTPSKKSKPECNYGAGCYQKGAEHLEKFNHPSRTPQQSTSGVLPNVFSGSKIFIPEDIPDSKRLKRYIIAYDGEVVKDFDKASATHSIVPTDYTGQPVKCDGVCVKVSWLLKCIKDKLLQPTKGFIVAEP